MSYMSNLNSFIADDPKENLRPCVPSPCGSNAICREQNGVGACECISDYFGNPYEGCRPECVHSSDCPSNKACNRNKCQDPCPGVCGNNAVCQVVNHSPSCTCLTGYIGNPYSNCNIQPVQRKKIQMLNAVQLLPNIIQYNNHLPKLIHKTYQIF